MLTKKQVSFVNSLKQKKYREKHKMFVAEGVKIVNELLHSSIKVTKIFSSKNFQLSLFNHHIEVQRISEEELKKISSLATPHEVLALCEIPDLKLDLSLLENKLVLVLDTIQDPGNLGTIIRVADWFGIKEIVCSKETADHYNAKVVQATMGSIARVNVFYEYLNSFIPSYLEKYPNNPIYGAFLDGNSIYESKLKKAGLLVIGNESKGISQDIAAWVNEKIKIPAFSDMGSSEHEVESLNAAIATAVICSEFRRRF